MGDMAPLKSSVRGTSPLKFGGGRKIDKKIKKMKEKSRKAAKFSI